MSEGLPVGARDLSAPVPGADRLRESNRAFAGRNPGEAGTRQPVHTVYGGGHLFRADTAAKLGQVGSRLLERYAPDAATLAGAVGADGDPDLLEAVYARVREKLAREAVEDFRIDFEDGYGNRPDEEEDAHARQAALEVARGLAAGTLPPFLGIRVKPLSEDLRDRSVRTLRVFLESLARETGGRVPEGFVLTLPKITHREQVEVFAELLAAEEEELGIRAGSLRIELMVETPQAIFGPDGRCPLRDFVRAGDGRVRGAHFGTYDYTALLGITAAHQRMHHPACSHARRVMQTALAGSGVLLSDGSTAILPAPPHPDPAEGVLPPQREAENRRAVHRAWRLHYQDVRASLGEGFYQGWDLHPGQIPLRYVAIYAFFLEGVEAAGDRLRNFLEKAAQATLLGDVFDDAATGQGLLNFFLRALNSGALSADEVADRTGLSQQELAARSFVAILEGRGQGET